MTETKEVIHFYCETEQYGYLSNFYKAPIRLEGKIWPSVEHYFQAMKFQDPKYQEKIRKSPNS